MKMKALALAFSCAASASSCAEAPVEGSLHVLENARIISSTTRPAPSGYLSTWIKLRVITQIGEKILFYQYFGQGQVIPEIGQTCTISYRRQAVEGITADEAVPLQRADVINSLKCKLRD